MRPSHLLTFCVPLIGLSACNTIVPETTLPRLTAPLTAPPEVLDVRPIGIAAETSIDLTGIASEFGDDDESEFLRTELQDLNGEHDQRPRDRRKRRFHFYGMFSGGVGDYDFDDDVYGHDDNTATLARMRFGAGNRHGNGGGVDLKFLFPDDNPYENTAVELDVSQFDMFFFFMHQASAGRFRMPLRVGPYVSGVNTELNSNGANTDYTNFGVRLEIEPEVVLMDSEGMGLSVVTLFSLGGHATYIDDDLTNDEYHSSGWTFNAEAGLRMRIGNIAVGSSFIYNEMTIDQSDRENGFRIPRLETEFTGVQFTVGVRF